MGDVTVKKPCAVCNRLKALSAFGLNAYLPDGHLDTCKECERRRGHDKEWTEQKIAQQQKAVALRTGLSVGTIQRQHLGRPHLNRTQYLRLFDVQGGRCAVCNQPEGIRDEGGEVLPLLLYVRTDGSIVDSGLICQSCDNMFKGARHSARILASGIAFISPSPGITREAHLYEDEYAITHDAQ